jgi:hypothetical protein
VWCLELNTIQWPLSFTFYKQFPSVYLPNKHSASNITEQTHSTINTLLSKVNGNWAQVVMKAWYSALHKLKTNFIASLRTHKHLKYTHMLRSIPVQEISEHQHHEAPYDIITRWNRNIGYGFTNFATTANISRLIKQKVRKHINFAQR